MSETTTAATATEVAGVMERLMGDFAATAGTVLTAIGLRTGLWDALAEAPGSAESVAARAGVAAPYALEWLRSQAAAGYVEFDPASGVFRAAPGVVEVMTGPLRGLAAGTTAQLEIWWAALDRYRDAFRNGRGIWWGSLPEVHSDAMDLITRTVIVPDLVGSWLPAMDGVAAKLAAGASVADVGCGFGAPTIAMAQAFPASRFVGFDLEEAAVSHARKAAVAAGVADRVRFEVAAATDIEGGPFDLVLFIDSLHDLGRPESALARARQLLGEDGVVLLVEHAGSEHLEENLHPPGRFFYACSALVCTPNALADYPAATPLGSIPGEGPLRRVAAAAGFSRVRRVDFDAAFNLLLELRS